MDFEQKNLIGITDVIDKSGFTPTTFTANFMKNYDILNFKEEDVDLNFIAMSLAKQCRYIGHTGDQPNEFLSVAQHSVMMAEAILLVTGDPKIAMEALMHDSAEAYFGDVPSPLKNLVKDVVKPIEDAIEKIIFEHFGLSYPMNPLVKKVDINICKYELTFAVYNDEPEKNVFDFWSPEDSYYKFFAMYNRLEKLLEIEKDFNKDRIFEFRNECILSAIFIKDFLGIDLKYKGKIALDLQNKNYGKVDPMVEIGRYLCKDFLDLIEEIYINHPDSTNSVKYFLDKLTILGDGVYKFNGENYDIKSMDDRRLLELMEKFDKIPY